MKTELHEAIKLTHLVRKYGDLRAEWAKASGYRSTDMWAASECVFDEIKRLIG